jgi:hypothetical protein
MAGCGSSPSRATAPRWDSRSQCRRTEPSRCATSRRRGSREAGVRELGYVRRAVAIGRRAPSR